MHISAYLICLLSFDRYARLAYLQRYRLVVTPQRSRNAIITAIATAVVNQAMNVTAVVNGERKTLGKASMVLNLSVAVLTIATYFFTLRALKRNRQTVDNPISLQQVDRTMTRFLLLV